MKLLLSALESSAVIRQKLTAVAFVPSAGSAGGEAVPQPVAGVLPATRNIRPPPSIVSTRPASLFANSDPTIQSSKQHGLPNVQFGDMLPIADPNAGGADGTAQAP